MYKFQVHAPDGVHLQDEEYETPELAAAAFKAENKYYNEISPTEFADADGRRHVIIKAASPDALKLFEVMSVLWTFTYEEMKKSSTDEGDRGMIGADLGDFLKELTEERYTELKEELKKTGYIKEPKEGES